MRPALGQTIWAWRQSGYYKNRGVERRCAVCDGALPRFRKKPLIVVGGGDSAVEEATYLSKFASRVYMVHRRDELRASKSARAGARESKIEPVWNHSLEEVLCNDKHGASLAFGWAGTADDGSTSGRRRACSWRSGCYTPVTPGVSRWTNLELTKKKYVKWTVPSGGRNTSVEGVFAAGDVADDYYRQAVTAAGSRCKSRMLDADRWVGAMVRTAEARPTGQGSGLTSRAKDCPLSAILSLVRRAVRLTRPDLQLCADNVA